MNKLKAAPAVHFLTNGSFMFDFSDVGMSNVVSSYKLHRVA